MWKQIPDHPMYEVSHRGEVRTWKKLKGRGRGKGVTVVRAEAPTILTKQYNRYSYVKIDGSPELVHRLVLEAFEGPCPEGQYARHLNGDPHDNRWRNLAWGTPTENQADKRVHKTQPLGSQVHNAKLTEAKVRMILRSRRPRRELAERYGVSVACIDAIFSRRNWKHVNAY
jgi:hypothetical protein